MSLKERISEANALGGLLLPWAFSILALIFGILCILFLIKERLSIASLSAGLLFLSVLLAYFPQLESVKALSIDVKMKQNLDRADEILQKVRELSLVTARSGLYTMAYAGRMGDISSATKADLINNVVRNLGSIGASKAEQESALRPLLDVSAFDIYYLIQRPLRELLVEQNGGDFSKASSSIAALTLSAQDLINELQIAKSASEQQDTLRRAVEKAIAIGVIKSKEDQARFEQLKDVGLRIYADLTTNLHFPAALGELTEKFSGANDLQTLRNTYP